VKAFRHLNSTLIAAVVMFMPVAVGNSTAEAVTARPHISSTLANPTDALGSSVSSARSSARTTPASACDGRPEGYKVRWYYPRTPYRNAPLRCGTSAWGMRHLIAHGRWNPGGVPFFENMIQTTVADPSRTISQGSAVRFEYDVTNRADPYRFIVIVEFANRDDGNPKGIITAYQSYS
jgi:hypothetical protein